MKWTATILLLLLTACTQYNRDSAPEYWQINKVLSKNRIELKQGWQTRTLEFCGIDTLPKAENRLKKLIAEIPKNKSVPVVFNATNQGIYYGDIWVPYLQGEEILSGILVVERLATINGLVFSCPYPEALKLAEELANDRENLANSD